MHTEERLIVAADFDPREVGGVDGVRYKVLKLAEDLSGSGVHIKVNSALRAAGYGLIDALHEEGLRVFADLKLNDIPNTLKIDAAMLAEYKPEMLTVMCSTGIDGMHIVQKVLPDTHVLGVTVLTSMNDAECRAIFKCSSELGVLRFARMAHRAGLRNLILSPKEIAIVKDHFDLALSFNTPGIRPEWSLVKSDDQSRVLTPTRAIESGADRIVIGRPITQARSPLDAVKRTLEEIDQGLANRTPP